MIPLCTVVTFSYRVHYNFIVRNYTNNKYYDRKILDTIFYYILLRKTLDTPLWVHYNCCCYYIGNILEITRLGLIESIIRRTKREIWGVYYRRERMLDTTFFAGKQREYCDYTQSLYLPTPILPPLFDYYLRRGVLLWQK